MAIFLVTIYSFLEWGGLVSKSKVGASVAKAREARVSMIRLTQSIWRAVKTFIFNKAAPIRVIPTATTLTVS